MDNNDNNRSGQGTGGGNNSDSSSFSGSRFNQGAVNRPAGASAGQRPVGQRPAGASAGQRPVGQRPAGASAGQRPTGTSAGQRPVGQRPTGTSAGQRPVGQRPAGTSAGQRPVGQRPAGMENSNPRTGELNGVAPTNNRYVKNNQMDRYSIGRSHLNYGSTNSEDDRYRTNNNRNEQETELGETVDMDMNREAQKELLKNKKKLRRKIIIRSILGLFLLAIVVVGIMYGPTIISAYNKSKTIIAGVKEEDFRSSAVSIAYDCNGKEMKGVFGDASKEYVTKADCESNMNAWNYAVHAVIDVEDKNFYDHKGVDPKGLAGAVWTGIKLGGNFNTRGGSTITQQLVKLVVLEDLNKTADRKVTEIFVALELEKKFNGDKDKIIEFYLNNVNYANAMGIANASKYYYGKKLNELNLAQIAYISAIPNCPGKYDPYSDSYDLDEAGYNVNTKTRMKLVLDKMLECESITKEEYTEAMGFDVESTLLGRNGSSSGDGSSISFYVKNYVKRCAIDALCEEQSGISRPYPSKYDDYKEYEAALDAYNTEYGIWEGKLIGNEYHVYTSIDLAKQEELQKAIDEELKGVSVQTINERNKDKGEAAADAGDITYAFQGAGVCIENSDKSAFVVAIVGGRSSTEGKVAENGTNRAYKTFRQPGSSFKPLVAYGPAFNGEDFDYTENSTMVDKDYSDEFPNEKFTGNAHDGYSNRDMTFKQAIAESTNTIAWKLFMDMGGQSNAWKYLSKMSFLALNRPQEDSGASMALGGLKNGVSSLEMAAAYSMIERGGTYFTPTCIKKITLANGSDVVTSTQSGTLVFDGVNTTQRLTTCLKEVFDNSAGTAKGHKLKNNWDCAGKTGTTNDYKDGWFVGYTTKYTTAIWCGYEDNSEGKTIKKVNGKNDSLAGGTFPLSIWEDYMNSIHSKMGDGSGETLDVNIVEDGRGQSAESPDDDDDDDIDMPEPSPSDYFDTSQFQTSTPDPNEPGHNGPGGDDNVIDEPPTDEPPTDEPPTDTPPTDEPPTDEPPTDELPTEPPTEPPANNEGDQGAQQWW